MVWMGLAISLWLTVFQLLLAGGAPLGALAWGGQDPGALPKGKRVASGASALLTALFTSAFGQAVGLWTLWPETLLWWIFAVGIPLWALSTLGNAATSSRIERLHGVPVAGGMLLACLAMVFRG